jgi:hypothetical protein
MGSRSNSGTWETTRSQFCSLDEAQFAAMGNAATQVRTASAVAYQSVVQCVALYADQQGLFGVFRPNERRDGFTIVVHHRTPGETPFQIRGVRAVPEPTSGFSCGENLHQTSLTAPRAITTAQFPIGCSKRPQDEFQVTVATSEGTLVYTAASIDQDMAELKSRLAILEGERLSRGTVLWSAEPSCPPGFEVYETARGRTIVGGGNTSNEDDRESKISTWKLGYVGGEEQHKLTDAEMPKHTHPTFLNKGTGGTSRYASDGVSGSNEEIQRGTTGSAGENSAHNNMPPFVALTPCIRR